MIEKHYGTLLEGAHAGITGPLDVEMELQTPDEMAEGW
jgi:hypothetical protein